MESDITKAADDTGHGQLQVEETIAADESEQNRQDRLYVLSMDISMFPYVSFQFGGLWLTYLQVTKTKQMKTNQRKTRLRVQGHDLKDVSRLPVRLEHQLSLKVGGMRRIHRTTIKKKRELFASGKCWMKSFKAVTAVSMSTS